MGDGLEGFRGDGDGGVSHKLGNMCNLFYSSMAQTKKQVEHLELLFSSRIYPAFVKESEAALAAQRLAHQESLQKWLQERHAMMQERKIAEQMWLQEKQGLIQARVSAERLWLQEKQGLMRERDALAQELRLLKMQQYGSLGAQGKVEDDPSRRPLNPFALGGLDPPLWHPQFGRNPWPPLGDFNPALWQPSPLGFPPPQHKNLDTLTWNPAFSPEAATSAVENLSPVPDLQPLKPAENSSSSKLPESEGKYSYEDELWWQKSQAKAAKNRVPPARVLQHRLKLGAVAFGRF